MRFGIILPAILMLILVGCTDTGQNQDSALTEQEMCEHSQGEWRQFPNSCADSCEVNRNPESILCAQSLTMGCDCGDTKCWDKKRCISI